MSIFQSFKIEKNINYKSPIEFENIKLSELKTINPAVSYNEFNPVSYWNDDKWDFSYTTDKSNKYIIDFLQYKDKISSNLYEEFKYIVYSLYISKSIYSTRTKAAGIASSLFILFDLLNKEGFNSIKALENRAVLNKILNKINGMLSFSTLKSKLNYLRDFENLNLKEFLVDFGFNSKKRIFTDNKLSMDNLAKMYANQRKIDKEQTLFIPNKIHSEIVFNAINVINMNYNILNNISNFLEDEYLTFINVNNLINKNNEEIDKSKIKRKIRTLRNSKNNDIKSISELIIKHNLPKRLNTYNKIKEECRLIATSSFILILTFSGMRNDELLEIKKDGYFEINTEPKLHFIRTFENKISGGQIVDYITSPIIKKVFDSLNAIQKVTRKYGEDTNKENLFLKEKNQKLFSYYDKSLMNKNLKWFVNKFNITVDSESFKEHQLINGKLRNEIKVGENWHLSAHQFRRTLIVNFVAHNLSTINEVKQQVKHMYATMTEYYAKNSQLASQFKLRQIDSMVIDIQKEQIEENVRKYKDFYYGNDILAGKKGESIIQERVIADVLSDDDIRLMFKTGAYKLTKSTYGYCTKGNACDKSGIADPSFCGMNCNTMIITRENAFEWKKLYERNEKLLSNNKDFLCYNGVNLEGAITMMKNQNLVAKKILISFGIEV